MTGRAPLEGRARSVFGPSVSGSRRGGSARAGRSEGTTGWRFHPVMSLSDFMPYGAPELVEGAEPRMARATLLASGLVAMMVWCLGIVVASQPAVRELPTVFPRIPTFTPQTYAFQKRQPPGPVIPKVTRPEGELQPIPDEPPVLPSIEEPGPIGPVTPEKGGEPDQTQGGGAVVPCPCDDPAPGTFVYTDEFPQLVRSV